MPKADQFTVGLALITTALAALLTVHSLAYGALFLGAYLIINPFIQDYVWGEYRPSTDQINTLSATEYQQKLNPKFDRWVKHISKLHPVKWELLIPVFLVLIVVGIAGLASQYTHKPTDQWVLDSYSTEKGYLFMRNGAEYEAHCRGMYGPIVAKDGTDLSAGMVPIPDGAIIEPLPIPVKPENFCSAILPYLHKSVPFRQSGDVLIYTEKGEGAFKNWTTELTIREAR